MWAYYKMALSVTATAIKSGQRLKSSFSMRNSLKDYLFISTKRTPLKCYYCKSNTRFGPVLFRTTKDL